MRQRAEHLGPEARRPLILDAALPLFAQRGFDDVSMQQIADAAGVSKPVLYSCFASKDELFDQLERREDRRLRDLVALQTRSPDRDGSEEGQLREVLTALLRAVQEMPDAFRILYVQAYGDDRIERGRAHWHERMQQIVEQHSDRPEREAAVLARMLVATAELGFTVMLDGSGDWTPEDLAAFLAGTVTNGMAVVTQT